MIEVLSDGRVSITLTKGDSDDVTVTVVDSSVPPMQKSGNTSNSWRWRDGPLARCVQS